MDELYQQYSQSIQSQQQGNGYYNWPFGGFNY